MDWESECAVKCLCGFNERIRKKKKNISQGLCFLFSPLKWATVETFEKWNLRVLHRPFLYVIQHKHEPLSEAVISIKQLSEPDLLRLFIIIFFIPPCVISSLAPPRNFIVDQPFFPSSRFFPDFFPFSFFFFPFFFTSRLIYRPALQFRNLPLYMADEISYRRNRNRILRHPSSSFSPPPPRLCKKGRKTGGACTDLELKNLSANSWFITPLLFLKCNVACRGEEGERERDRERKRERRERRPVVEILTFGISHN